MEIPRYSIRSIIFVGVVLGAIRPSVATAADPPAPTPTPRPGTLAAVAIARPLNRAPGTGGSATIVITNDNLERLGDGAALTVLTSTIADAAEIESTEIDPETRDRWRKKVLAQGKIIARLQARRTAVEHKIDRLERGRLDSRTLDRIATAEAELRAIDLEIGREKSALGRLVRAARTEGAQPGWFR